MDRYTATDKEYITYQEAKDKGWNEYACREEELKRRLKLYEDTRLTPEEIMDGKWLTGWIPVKERLPDSDGTYLVTQIFYGKTMVDLLEYSLVNGWHTVAEKVIAWIPLPEPYKPVK